jgi:hypothetical protein
MLQAMEKQLGTLSGPQHWVFVNGGITLGAWAIILANEARLRQWPWQFTVTHSVPAVVHHTQRWTQWYPEITVLEVETDAVDPAHWPLNSGFLMHHLPSLSVPSSPHFLGCWPISLWQRWQWRAVPNTLKAGFLRFNAQPMPAYQHWGNGLYTSDLNAWK